MSSAAIEDLKAYTDHAVRSAKQDLKVWLMGTLIAFLLSVVVPMGGIVFYLGKISNKLDQSFQTQSAQQATLNDRREWMDRRERVEESLVMWATTKGYAAPEPAR